MIRATGLSCDSELSRSQRVFKRLFDLVLSIIGLILFGWIIVIVGLLARIDTGQSGIFRQLRVGRGGRCFEILKIRTMRNFTAVSTVITTANDLRITPLGKLIRRAKFDELPQLINVLTGQMSFVGPRPDVPGYADRLSGCDQVILSVRPGITGPATLKYRDEEKLLADQEDPQRYNDEVIFPDKVLINRKYVKEYSFFRDMGYIWLTIFPTDQDKDHSIER